MDCATGGDGGVCGSEGDKKKTLEGETKSKRKMKTASQLELLEKSYFVEAYPSEAVRAELSVQLGLSDRQLQMWFCHRRLKDRKLQPGKRAQKDSHVLGGEERLMVAAEVGSDKKKTPEGETKSKRKMKTASQLEILEKSYFVEAYPSEVVRAELSVQLGLSDRQLQMWFCHRRLKDRKLQPGKRAQKDSPVLGGEERLMVAAKVGSEHLSVACFKRAVSLFLGSCMLLVKRLVRSILCCMERCFLSFLHSLLLMGPCV